MLEVINAKKRYQMAGKDLWALNGVNIKIEAGDFVALRGPSGSGKSTLLNVLGLLDTMTEGSYRLNGDAMEAKTAKERSAYRAQYLGFIFQNYNLIPELTVFENVEVPLLISGAKRKDYAERVNKIIADVGLAEHIKHRPGELSGGQQQRVSIARALVKQPPLIIADEPTANLDSKTGQDIMKLMAELNKKYGVTFVFATHDENIVSYMSKVFYLLDGQLVEGVQK
jgi:putative ABC transport system ATP-binding protein